MWCRRHITLHDMPPPSVPEMERKRLRRARPTQRPASEFLEITYRTTDLLTTLEAIGPKNDRPVVFFGKGGQGKVPPDGSEHPKR
jgi:hypothetical protein